MAVVVLAACSSPTKTAERVIARSMRDPDQVQFRDVAMGADSTTVCGEVNATNGFGAKVGFARFVYSTTDSMFSVASEDVPINDNLWALSCVPGPKRDSILARIKAADSGRLTPKTPTQVDSFVEAAAQAARAKASSGR